MEMICAECDEAVDASEGEVCPECGHSPQLDKRYRLVDRTFVGSLTPPITPEQLVEEFPGAEGDHTWQTKVLSDTVTCEAEFRDDDGELARLTCTGREASKRQAFVETVREKRRWLTSRYGPSDTQELPSTPGCTPSGPEAVEGTWRWKDGDNILELSFEHDSGDVRTGRATKDVSENNPDQREGAQSGRYVTEQRFPLQ
jgi:hypothetical protein